ncbi:ester cyclase [Rhizobium sp. L1K21]|uniref:ester cyclase n=1 Tax=Rhizobium sp. L1K21 TaxID=2954933 RepID=UPI002093AE02|nr:ester cyclase [Rhizobium sp. L1K21]
MKKYLSLGAAFAALLNSFAVAQAADEASCVALTRAFWINVFDKRNADVAMDYLSPNYIQHVAPPQPPISEWVDTWRGVFATPPTGPGKDFPEAQSDYKTEIVSIVGDEMFAALRAHDTGHWDAGPDKGKAFDFHYYDIFRCENGKLAEHWYSEDPDPTVGK